MTVGAAATAVQMAPATAPEMALWPARTSPLWTTPWFLRFLISRAENLEVMKTDLCC